MIAPSILVGRRVHYNPGAGDEALFLAFAGGGKDTLYVVVLKDDGSIAEWCAGNVTVLGPGPAGPYR